MKHIALSILISILFFPLGGKAAWRGSKQENRTDGKDSLQVEQLMVVLTNGWDSLRGTIYCFEKRKGKWVQLFNNAVVVGSKGLGIGEGELKIDMKDVPIKKEGDLKSPAGIFTIGTAFGYADNKDAKWIKNPYVKATDTLICVDDLRSAHYNTLINNDPDKSDWNSFEEMHRKDDAYKWGLFINHNAPDAKAGKGSCIFMHIWENDSTGTVGCTAMAEGNLLRILHWINAAHHPLLIQITKMEYAMLAASFHLPEINFHMSY